MKAQIKKCCDARDELAHCIWVDADGKPGLRLTDGFYETPEGKRSRAILPQAVTHSDQFFDQARKVILITVKAVRALQAEIKA